MVGKQGKVIVQKNESGPAVEDVQRKLNQLGYLKDSEIDSFYGDKTAEAVRNFSIDNNLEPTEDVTEKLWALLVDASFKLGDRNLFLRIPYFHGNDVLQLQKALGSLGFPVKDYDGIFGTSTERALRRFQINMGLPRDGIAGSQTFMTLQNLKFTWSDKSPLEDEKTIEHKNVWRASEVLENNSICLFGTDGFTRDVAKRMSNLSRATNPFSKILCSTAFSIAPDKDTLLLHIALPEENDIADQNCPRVLYSDDDLVDDVVLDDEDNSSNSSPKINLLTDLQGQQGFVKRLVNAINVSKQSKPSRITIQIPGKVWWDAGEDRSAQHFAINILDALCSALDQLDNLESNLKG